MKKKEGTRKNVKGNRNKRNQYDRILSLSHFDRIGTTGFPDGVRTYLTYAQIISIAPGAQSGQYTFRGNSVFDPDYTGGGHQPVYRDIFATVYSRYRVLGSKIIVSVANEQASSALQITVVPASTITAFTTSTYPIEHPHAKMMRLVGVGAILTGRLTHVITTKQLLGLMSNEIKDQDYSALVGAQPASEWYWQIVAQDLSVQNVACSVQVVIVYDVEFYDRADVIPSVTAKITPEQAAKLAHGPFPYSELPKKSSEVLYKMVPVATGPPFSKQTQ